MPADHHGSARPRRWRLERRAPKAMTARGVILCLALAASACAGHSSKTLEARNALDAMQPRRALALLDEQLDVDSPKELPADVGGDNALFILDRAMVLQQLEDYKLSSRDLQVADKQIEVLDFSRTALDDLGKYVFSDSSGPYKAPAYEKLMINSVNMVNYLARGDLNGARIEARRLAVMQTYIKSHKDPAAALSGPGSYLAGFVFEKSGKPDEALRYYDEALQYGDYASLHAPIRRLAARAGYRSPRIRRILDEANAATPNAATPATPATPNTATPPTPNAATPPTPNAATPPTPNAATPPTPNAATPPTPNAATPATPPATRDSAPDRQTPAAPDAEPAELLVVVSFGRVPAKIAKRVPIGLALTYASGALSPYDRSRANSLALQGLVTWVNYPELGRARGQYEQPGFALDGQWQRLEGIVAVDREVRRAWDELRGSIVAAAITRMIARVVAGEVTRRAVGGWEGLLLSLGTQATLTATDTPDTRSWATLPARIAFGRVELPPGTHTVVLEARGVQKSQKIKIKAGGWAVVNLTVLG